MKRTFLLSILLCGILQYGHAQLLDTYDISTSPNGVIAMPTGLPSAYSTFVKYTKIQAPNGKAIHFIAQNAITEAQIVRARNILQFYLTNLPGSQYGTDKTAVTNKMGTNEAILMLINGSDGDADPPNVNGQPLYQNEMAVEGSAWYINNNYDHRDAAYEEILHLMHDFGIGVDNNGTPSPIGALPAYQAEIRAAQDNADNNNFAIWPIGSSATSGWYFELLQENSLSQEYLASVIDVYYGLWGAWTEAPGGMWGLYIAKTRADIETQDPMGWALMPKYFSPFINVNMDIDPAFNGSFTMTFDAAAPYTHKSQYLQHCTLTGTNASNLKGNAEYNRLNGNEANNTLEGLKGNDRLDGKAGSDIAKFTGNYADYTVSTQGAMTIVMDNTSDRDGIDTLLNIETMQFTDQNVGITTGVDNISADRVFKAFPNPATDILTIEFVSTGNPIKAGEIKLFDQIGRVVYHQTFDNQMENAQLAVEQLTSSIYLLQITDGQKSSSKKIIIK